MNLNIVLFSLLLFLVSPNTDDTLLWREDFKLSWKDFKGKKDIETDAVAVTASGITFGYSVRKANARIINFTPMVEAHFYPTKSWVIKEAADDYILAHEQLHFDITELHVRKFRKQLKQVKISSHLNTDLDELHKNINKELAAMQNQYDIESHNSINKEAQGKWIVFVAKELKKYEAFKSKE